MMPGSYLKRCISRIKLNVTVSFVSFIFILNVFSWVATQFGERSGSVILEVDIPTGWFVRKQQLRIYQRVSRIESQRSRFTKQKVVLFMDYVSMT